VVEVMVQIFQVVIVQGQLTLEVEVELVLMAVEQLVALV
jgi:hypothetical protein